jgi:hypothetical protein
MTRLPAVIELGALEHPRATAVAVRPVIGAVREALEAFPGRPIYFDPAADEARRNGLATLLIGKPCPITTDWA